MTKLTGILKTFGLLFAFLSVVIADYREDALKVHNKYRAEHGAPNLCLNSALNEFAQKYAEKLAKENKFEHSNGKYGENLYMFGGTEITNSKAAEQATDSWYDEIKEYDFKNPGFSSGTGHFTQVVWKTSKNLGIGVGVNGKKYYVVASYDPPGNVGGEFPANVLEKSSNPDSGKGDTCPSSDASKYGTSIFHLLCLFSILKLHEMLYL